MKFVAWTMLAAMVLLGVSVFVLTIALGIIIYKSDEGMHSALVVYAVVLAAVFVGLFYALIKLYYATSNLTF